MTTLNFILLALVAIISAAVATDYCSSKLCSTGVTHIACNNSGNFDSSCPSDAGMVKFDSSLKATLLDGHNEKRNLVAGGSVSNLSPACRMATMEWDAELADIAAYNVRQCVMAHDKCRNTEAFKFSGQSLASINYNGELNSTAQVQKSLSMWYNEVEYTNMDIIESYPSNYQGPDIGHFTVMVADRNIRVGCAAATYSKSKSSFKTFLMACNYATNNMVNFPIYASCSKSATSCSTGTNPKYSNLCSTSESYDVNKWH